MKTREHIGWLLLDTAMLFAMCGLLAAAIYHGEYGLAAIVLAIDSLENAIREKKS